MPSTVLLLATGFCSGYIPFAPGTFGSAVGVALCFGLSRLPTAWAAAAVAGFCLVSIWVAGRAESLLKRKDAPCIVIDEMAGMAVSLLGLPFTPVYVVSGFAVFRLLDVLKPFPARWIDRRAGGGLGIVLDDVVAGVYTNLALRAAALWVASL
jgi:phosphatidylglycerophosphatase A